VWSDYVDSYIFNGMFSPSIRKEYWTLISKLIGKRMTPFPIERKLSHNILFFRDPKLDEKGSALSDPMVLFHMSQFVHGVFNVVLFIPDVENGTPIRPPIELLRCALLATAAMCRTGEFPVMWYVSEMKRLIHEHRSVVKLELEATAAAFEAAEKKAAADAAIAAAAAAADASSDPSVETEQLVLELFAPVFAPAVDDKQPSPDARSQNELHELLAEMDDVDNARAPTDELKYGPVPLTPSPSSFRSNNEKGLAALASFERLVPYVEPAATVAEIEKKYYSYRLNVTPPPTVTTPVSLESAISTPVSTPELTPPASMYPSTIVLTAAAAAVVRSPRTPSATPNPTPLSCPATAVMMMNDGDCSECGKGSYGQCTCDRL
jgi:hypothetical protein